MNHIISYIWLYILKHISFTSCNKNCVNSINFLSARNLSEIMDLFHILNNDSDLRILKCQIIFQRTCKDFQTFPAEFVILNTIKVYISYVNNKNQDIESLTFRIKC